MKKLAKILFVSFLFIVSTYGGYNLIEPVCDLGCNTAGCKYQNITNPKDPNYGCCVLYKQLPGYTCAQYCCN